MVIGNLLSECTLEKFNLDSVNEGFHCVSGEKGAAREHKSTFHAISRIVRSEGFLSVYNG